jgi:hypothetical protein
VRHARLRAREKADFLARWHELWNPVERYYHQQLRPASSYDFVIQL